MASLSAQLVQHGLFPDRPTGTVSAVPLNSDRSTKVPVPKLHATGTSCFGGGLSLRLSPKRRIVSRHSWLRETCRFFRALDKGLSDLARYTAKISLLPGRRRRRFLCSNCPFFQRSCMLWIAIFRRIPLCSPQRTTLRESSVYPGAQERIRKPHARRTTCQPLSLPFRC